MARSCASLQRSATPSSARTDFAVELLFFQLRIDVTGQTVSELAVFEPLSSFDGAAGSAM